VERSETVRAPCIGSGEAVRLAEQKPIPRIVGPGRGNELEDKTAAAVRGMHERADATVIARSEGVGFLIDQGLQSGGVTGVDELKDRKGWVRLLASLTKDGNPEERSRRSDALRGNPSAPVRASGRRRDGDHAVARVRIVGTRVRRPSDAD